MTLVVIATLVYMREFKPWSILHSRSQNSLEERVDFTLTSVNGKTIASCGTRRRLRLKAMVQKDR